MKLIFAIIAFLLICSGFYNTWLVTRRTDVLHDPAPSRSDLQRTPPASASHI